MPFLVGVSAASETIPALLHCTDHTIRHVSAR
jgi:hypothetical protein